MVFGIKKMIREAKKATKEAKKSINRSWKLIITITDLEIDCGAKIPPLIKVVISGATMYETNLCLDKVSTNSLNLNFKSLFLHWVSFFSGVSTFKRLALGPRGLSQDRLRVHSGRVNFAHVYT
jgi:hypothetical protein